MQNAINLDRINIDSNWLKFLKDEFLSHYFLNIKKNYYVAKMQNELIFPYSHLIFNAFNMTPLDNLKIVLLGQDPYHNAHFVNLKDVDSQLIPKNAIINNDMILLPEAMGLSFCVPKNIKIPPSLKNIYKELSYTIDFQIPNHGDLRAWAKNGMLLLNAILSVKAHTPASHKYFGWEQFTDNVIKRISDNFTNIIFILLGKYAQNKAFLIDDKKHFILKAPHPSPLSRGFIGSNVFKNADDILKSLNIDFSWNVD